MYSILKAVSSGGETEVFTVENECRERYEIIFHLAGSSLLDGTVVCDLRCHADGILSLIVGSQNAVAIPLYISEGLI